MFFSIIIPVFNNILGLVDRAIQSALNQEFDDFEIVLINDGATDKDIIEYMQSWESNKKICYVHSTQNLGISAARQLGIRHASGEWICFLDCDDYIKTNYLTEFLRVILHNDNLDVVMSGYEVSDSKGKMLSKYPADRAKYINSEYLFYASTAIWNRAYRKSFLIENDIHFPKNCMTEDMTFLAQICSHTQRMEYTNCYTYVNYYNKLSTSRSKRFTRLSVNEMPFRDILDILNTEKIKEKNEQKNCLYGMMYEQLIVLGCLLSRNIRNRRDVQIIIRRSCELIDSIPEVNKCVVNWNKETGTKIFLKLIERVIALSAGMHCEYYTMYAINRLLGMILKN